MGRHNDASALIHSWHASAPSADIALGLADAGDAKEAAALVAKLAQLHPKDTLLNDWMLPEVRAVLLLQAHNEAGARAALAALHPTEALGLRDPSAPYLRGKAYLQLHQENAAAREFQSIVDAPGASEFSPLYCLSLRALARIRMDAGDAPAAQALTARLLTLWQHADQDYIKL